MEPADFNARRVLVVEDEPSIGSVCQRVLTREGFAVDIALNGKAAQNMIGEKQYDLLLVDVRTPGMNGMELYEWLKQNHPHLTSGVIFTTGDVLGSNIGRFLKQTGRPFLPKPFSPDDLKAVVRQALQ